MLVRPSFHLNTLICFDSSFVSDRKKDVGSSLLLEIQKRTDYPIRNNSTLLASLGPAGLFRQPREQGRTENEMWNRTWACCCSHMGPCWLTFMGRRLRTPTGLTQKRVDELQHCLFFFYCFTKNPPDLWSFEMAVRLKDRGRRKEMVQSSGESCTVLYPLLVDQSRPPDD
jgi:hypothetical protein